MNIVKIFTIALIYEQIMNKIIYEHSMNIVKNISISTNAQTMNKISTNYEHRQSFINLHKCPNYEQNYEQTMNFVKKFAIPLKFRLYCIFRLYPINYIADTLNGAPDAFRAKSRNIVVDFCATFTKMKNFAKTSCNLLSVVLYYWWAQGSGAVAVGVGNLVTQWANKKKTKIRGGLKMANKKVKYREFYKGYTITKGFIRTKTVYLVDGCIIFLSAEEAKLFCDKFTNKSELAEMLEKL